MPGFVGRDAELRARRVVPPAVRDAHDARHDRVGDLDRDLDFARRASSPGACAPSASPSRAASSGWTCIVQRSLPFTSTFRLCIQELFERSSRRPISTIEPLRGDEPLAQPLDVGDDLGGRELDLARRRAQHLGDARLERPEVDSVRALLELLERQARRSRSKPSP